VRSVMGSRTFTVWKMRSMTHSECSPRSSARRKNAVNSDNVGGVPAKLPGTKTPTLALVAIPLSFPSRESARIAVHPGCGVVGKIRPILVLQVRIDDDRLQGTDLLEHGQDCP